MSKAYNVLENSEILGTLTPEEYWKLRFGQVEMEKANLQVSMKTLKKALIEKDVQLLMGKINSMKSEVNQALSQEIAAKKDYELTRKDISDRLGADLKGCIIDDVTLEVTRDNDDKPEPGGEGEDIKDDETN